MGIHSSAFCAVSVKLGSTTTSLQPRFFASMSSRLSHRPLIGAEVVHSPQDHVTGVDEVVHRKDMTEQRQARRAPVLLAPRRMRVHVRAAVEVAEQRPVEHGVRVVVAGERHRFRAPPLLDAGQLAGDEIEGLVPGYPAEPARLALRVGAQHRVLQSVRVLSDPPARHSLRAPRADVVRRPGVALVVDDSAVAHVHLGRTLPRTGVAEALHDLRLLDACELAGEVGFGGGHQHVSGKSATPGHGVRPSAAGWLDRTSSRNAARVPLRL